MRIDINETSMKTDIYVKGIGPQWTSIKPERNM